MYKQPLFDKESVYIPIKITKLENIVRGDFKNVGHGKVQFIPDKNGKWIVLEK